MRNALPERRSVCVFVFVAEPFRVLLLRRVAARAAGWQPVTGRIEETDASLVDACIREIREETGLGAPLEVIDLAHETSFVGYDGATYHQRTFAARYQNEMSVHTSEEHEEAQWVDADEATRLLTWPENREALAWLLHRQGKR